MQRILPVVLAAVAALSAGPAEAAPAGFIREFRVLSSAPAYGGAGPYEVITGTVHGELDPADPANAGIADLKLPPTGPDGMVAYSTDVVILRPMRARPRRHRSTPRW